MNYHNLDLDLFDFRAEGGTESFRVRVAASPVGEQRLADAEPVSLDAALREQMARLDRRELGWAELIALGEALAGLLFPPVARGFLLRSLERLDADEGLRLRLRLDAFALADLPWEYVYVARSGAAGGAKGAEGFLALDRRLSLVRYEVLEQSPGTLDPVGGSPLRLVALLANPSDLAPLSLELERQAIERALAKVAAIQSEFYPDATVDTIEEAFGREAHVFHFAGHGTWEGDLSGGAGFIVLLDDQTMSFPFSAERLALNLTGRGVRLAVLGACEAGRRDQRNAWSGVAPALTRAGIPAVLGMQYTVRDSSALAFHQRFYQALAAGQPIDAAVADGRLAIFNRTSNDERDWGVPVLYLRAAEGTLFPKGQMVAQGMGWTEVAARLREQATRFLADAQGTPERPGTFLPQVYVERAAERTLDAFLASPAPAALVIGESGAGKTSLLLHWTSELLAQGHGALLYACARLPGADIERELARDLALAGADEVLPALARIGALATGAGQQVVLLFDALNEFRGGEQADLETLVKALDALAQRLPAGVRLVASCNVATWEAMGRRGLAPLFDTRFFRPAGADPFVRLEGFSPHEFALAYPKYRVAFGLQTPLDDLSAALRERLRKPLLLRMLAESFRNREVPANARGLTLQLLQQFYEERVRQRRDQLFVEGLVAEMLRQRRATLRVDDLARDERLRDEIIADDADSSYYRLLDTGILSETQGDPVQGDTVGFTYTQVGAYALALYLLRRAGPGGTIFPTLAALVREARSFPLAWEIARTLLLIHKDPATLATLATSTDVELRQLAVEGLVEIHADMPDRAIEMMRGLLEADSEEARRAGLKAAYCIGTGAREIFLWAAAKGSPAVRQAAKYTLYLLWRTDPAFVFGLLTELAGRVGIAQIASLRNIVEFVVEVPVTIYINHCDRRELVQQITTLHYDLLKNRLHLDRVNTGIFGATVEELIFGMAARAFSQPILDVLLLTELSPAETFFALTAEERAGLKRLLPFLDPATDLQDAQADLEAMFASPVLTFNVVGAMVLAIHASHRWETTRPVAEALWERLPPSGRLWALLSFSLLLPDTPPEWVDFLEPLTARFMDEHPALFNRDESSFLDSFDIVLLPLGLAYGKRGGGMPLFETRLRDAMAAGDRRALERLLAGLGAVGFYYPNPVFATLRATIPKLLDPALLPLLARALATMRVLHFDEVDIFLQQIGADEGFGRQVAAAADVGLVRRYISWLGLFNNNVHAARLYPTMRRVLIAPTLELLAEARAMDDYIARFTVITLRAAREADYQFSNWAKLEAEGG